MKNFRPLLSIGLALSLGCSVEANDNPTPTETGPIFGLRPDGRINITAREAWPGRVAEPPPVTREEVIEACVMLAACQPDAPGMDRGNLVAVCSNFGFWEERAVPQDQAQERWSFGVRAILASGGNCKSIEAASTKRVSAITCEETGCTWSSMLPVPKVTCIGDVATLTTEGKSYVRDCTRSYTRCDISSPTGCTDRPRTRCDAKATDRCDGNIKLGCDGSGHVSFHDCALISAKCVEKAGGATCVPVAAVEPAVCKEPSCSGSKLTNCSLGAMATINCAEIGYSRCDKAMCVK